MGQAGYSGRPGVRHVKSEEERHPVIGSGSREPQTGETEKKMAFCNYCGTKNDEGMRFCIRCGKPLQAGEVVQERAVQEKVVQERATSGDGWYIRDGNLIISATDMGILWRNGEFPWNHAKEEVKSVIFVVGMTKIESGAFDGFVNLESVMMPNDVSEIQGRAFQNCKSLKSITLPDTGGRPMQIMSNAFKGCDGLTKVLFSDTLPIMEERVFDGCGSINTVQFRGKTFDSIGKLYEYYLGIGEQP